MKMKFSSVVLGLAVALAADLPAQDAADASGVVAAVNGVDYTAEELDHLRTNLPAVFKRNTAHMDNKTFLETFAYLKTLEALALEEGLDEKEPYKTQLEFNNTNFLAQAYLARINSTLDITPEDREAYLKDHRSEFEEVRVAAIYIDYSPIPELAAKEGRQVVTEQEARAEAEALLTELRQGADFAELAREHSDDAASAANGGELGYFKPGEAGLSPALREAIFKLEAGQVSTPIKDGGRFYIFKALERRLPEISDLQGRLLQGLQSQKLSARLDEIKSGIEIEIRDPNWVAGSGPSK